MPLIIMINSQARPFKLDHIMINSTIQPQAPQKTIVNSSISRTIANSSISSISDYRIVKVLANQDYLAINYQRQQFILSPAPTHQQHTLPIDATLPHSIAHPGINSVNKSSINKAGTRLLLPTELIKVDSLSYCVFRVGEGELTWARMIDRKRIKHHGSALALFKQAIKEILYNLLWLNHHQARSYIDQRNLWLIDGDLHLLLMPRHKLPSSSIRKVERHPYSIKKVQRHRSLCRTDSALAVVSQELQTMKLFGLFLWEVFSQSSWESAKESKGSHNTKSEVLDMVAAIIKKTLTFQQLQQKISKQEDSINHLYRHSRRRTSTLSELRQRRKTEAISRKQPVYSTIAAQSPHKKKQTQQLNQRQISYNNSFTQPRPCFVEPKSKLSLLHNKKRFSQFGTRFQTKSSADGVRQHSLSNKYGTISIERYQGSLQYRKMTIKQKLSMKSSKLGFRQSYSEWVRPNLSSGSLLEERLRRESEAARQKYQLATINKQPSDNSDISQKATDVTNKLIQKLNRLKRHSALKQSQTVKHSQSAVNHSQSAVNHSQSGLKHGKSGLKHGKSGLKQKISNSFIKTIMQMKSSRSFINPNISQNQPKPDQSQIQILEQLKYKPLGIQQFLQHTVQSHQKQKRIESHQNQQIVYSQKQYSFISYKQQSQHQKILLNNNQKTLQNNKQKILQNQNKHRCESDKWPIDEAALNMATSLQSQSFVDHRKQIKGDKHSPFVNASILKSSLKPKVVKNASAKPTDRQEDSQIEQITFNKSTSQPKQVKTDIPAIDQQLNYKNIIRAQDKLLLPLLQVPSFELVQSNKPRLSAQIDDIVTLYNILGDITVKAIRSKNILADLQWKKSVYFLYERFAYQRCELLTKMQKKLPLQLRAGRQFTTEEWTAWYESQESSQLLVRTGSQNLVIIKTLRKISDKMLEEGKLEKKVEHFLRNRDFMQQRMDPLTRRQITKIAIIYTIDLYDQIHDDKKKEPDIVEFIQGCFFGLRIVAELDGVLEQCQRVSLKDYRSQPVELQQLDAQVDMLYGLYFPQKEEKC